MGKLDEYREKRHFETTPEPAGEVHAEGDEKPLSYVIQKHAASRMHWDFRIELDGVLLSWAVPKGPSLDFADKRLAMHVEDHPVEYGSFEGVIPKGEYGGGTVMLWDRGTWRPDHGDPREHLAQGHLKFDLFGERLRGRWMLVRTKGYGGSDRDSWLLFKEHDEEERPKSQFEAVKEWMTSVATGRTMDQIAADVEATWHSNESVAENIAHTSGLHPPGEIAAPKLDAASLPGAKKAAMPKRVDVELATLVKDVPEGEGWLHEVKYDGYRIVAFASGGKVRLVSRNQNDWTERFSPIADAVKGLDVSSAIFDGEVVVMKPDGTSDFQALQNFARSGKEATLHYMIFDLLYVDGIDLARTPLEQRKKLLRQLLPENNDLLTYADHIEGHGDVFFNQACQMELEGVVSKRRDSIHRPGRQKEWLKEKCLLRQEFVVVGYTDPGGARSAFGALVLAVHDNGDLRHVGRVGTGFSDASLRDIHERLKKLDRTEAPVVNPPKGPAAKGVHWVDPKLVAEVSFAEWTSEESLRHPSFLGLREDKKPAEVIAEKPAPLPPPPPADPPAGAGDSVVAGVKLTNPDRILWPDLGVTKLELVHYYESVAERMLPHCENRPLSLVRCPTGYTGECFYQKHIENFPKQVGTVGIYEPEEDKTVPYACVTGISGVVGLAQMGVLEIHPWGSRADDPDKPDRLIFDLDPDPELPWASIAATALLLHSELSRLGLDSWLKTTGGKGLHIVVPVQRRQTWTQARDFTRAFVNHIVSLDPRLFTSNMSKAKREGKIFIDYVRNTRGSTAIAPFSTRARPGCPVSVPLAWDEIEGATERPEFTIRNVHEHLAKQPEDPWRDLLSSRQSITKKAMLKVGVS